MAKVKVDAIDGGFVGKAVRDLLSFSDTSAKKMADDAVAMPGGSGAASGAKGAAGVAATRRAIEANGGKVLAQEVTIVAKNGKRVRADLLVKGPDGRPMVVEVKTGRGAGLTKNQETGYPSMHVDGGEIRGRKGEAEGLPSGTRLPEIPVYTVNLQT